MEEMKECDVCVILDDDHTEKSVKYCSLCKKMLCERCRKSPRRVPAAVKYHADKIKHAFLSGLGIAPEPEKEE